jgi:neutral ceramidase
MLQAITDAHNNMQPASLEVAQGALLDANVNRSPSAYLANPEEERLGYEHNVDKNMTLLKVMGSDGGYVIHPFMAA